MPDQLPPVKRPPRAKNKRGANEKKKVRGRTIIPAVVQAALGATTFTQATKELSEKDSKALSRALRQDVDQWRGEFAAQLRSAGSQLLTDLQDRASELKPGEIAYALSVVSDKHSALDGRAQLAGATVNVQVNNYSPEVKEDLLRTLLGFKDSKPTEAVPVNARAI